MTRAADQALGTGIPEALSRTSSSASVMGRVASSPGVIVTSPSSCFCSWSARGCHSMPSERMRQAHLSSSSVVGQRMAASFGIEFPDGVVDGLIEVVRSGEGLVSEVMPLQVAPETLDIVQLRSVFRQPLDPEPMSPLGEGGTSRLAGVDRTVVEDQNEGLDRDA